VLVRSNNRLPLWATAIHPQAETACVLLHSTGSGFSSLLVARFPFRVSGLRANAVRGTGESCLVAATFVIRFRGTKPTSLVQSFPGRPGLSVIWLIQTFVSTNRSLQASGALFDIAGTSEGFHASCLDVVSFPD
jgi:hypothetical protein